MTQMGTDTAEKGSTRRKPNGKAVTAAASARPSKTASKTTADATSTTVTNDENMARLIAATAHIERFLSKRRASDKGSALSLRSLSILLLLAKSGRTTVRELAEGLDLNKPAITRGIDTLEELSLAKRSINMQDRRSPIIDVTAAGTSLLAELGKSMSKATASKQTA